MPYAVSVPPVDFNEKLLISVPCGNVITKEPSLLLHTLHNELPLTPHLPYIFLLLSSNSTFAPSTEANPNFWTDLKLYGLSSVFYRTQTI